MQQSMLEPDHLEISLAEKDLNVLMDKLTAVNLAAKKSDPSQLFWPGETHLDSGFWMLCWGPHYKRAHGYTGVTSAKGHKDD